MQDRAECVMCQRRERTGKPRPGAPPSHERPTAPRDGSFATALDRERLLPADDKRRRDLAKRLDKPPDSNGGATYIAGLAHTIGTGKAQNRRNAEIAVDLRDADHAG